MIRYTGTSRRPIRVAHLTWGLDIGGLEKLLVEFARHSDRRRFDLSFVSLTTRGRLAEDIEACGWPVIALEEPAGFRPELVLRLAPLLRRLRIDVLHTHDHNPLIYGAPAARLAGVRRLVHTGHCATLTHITRRQVWLTSLAARLVDIYACVSNDAARIAAGAGVRGKRLRTVWNGIDLSRFPCSGPRSEGPALLVARLCPEKDIGTLLRALAIAVKQQPDFHLEIAGTGPTRAELLRLSQELHLGSNVRFLGEVRDIAGLLAGASMFVLSSLTEGISLTLLEAMSAGLPVVATRVGGNPEIVVDGATGNLVPPADPEALACAMLALRRAPVAGRNMGLAGRERVERCFSIRRMVAEYEMLYTSQAIPPVRAPVTA
jgi:glycosyltransferase involved in cell wall biosynthesis